MGWGEGWLKHPSQWLKVGLGWGGTVLFVLVLGLGCWAPGDSLAVAGESVPSLRACQTHLSHDSGDVTLLEAALAHCTPQRFPAAPSLWLYRGLAHYRLGHYGAAIAALSHYLNMAPSDGVAYYNRGLAYSALGQAEAALQDYQQAAMGSASWGATAQANLYNDMGLLYFSLGQPQVALAYLDYAIALDDQDPRGHFNRGCICHHQHRYQEAIAAFGQALARSPDFVEAYVNRAMARYGLGDRAGAIADLQTAADSFQRQGQTQATHQVQQLLYRFQIPSSTLG